MSKDKVMWDGDWRTLEDKVCSGNIEVWDQTIGCPECGMNLWFLPKPEFWPSWAGPPPKEDHWDRTKYKNGASPYDMFYDLFLRLHPFAFGDCHDSGDEDSQAWEDL